MLDDFWNSWSRAELRSDKFRSRSSSAKSTNNEKSSKSETENQNMETQKSAFFSFSTLAECECRHRPSLNIYNATQDNKKTGKMQITNIENKCRPHSTTKKSKVNKNTRKKFKMQISDRFRDSRGLLVSCNEWKDHRFHGTSITLLQISILKSNY